MTSPPNMIDVVERIWRRNAETNRRLGTADSAAAEQESWDAYADLCDVAGQCLTPGCRRPTKSAAYCSKHRLE